MKSLEQIKKLAENPFYELTVEEQKVLDNANVTPDFKISSLDEIFTVLEELNES